MKYSVYETNSDGTQKFSDVRIVDAWTAQQAATKYPDQFQLDKSATHLWVRSEDRNLELFSIQPKHVSNAKTGLSKYSIVYIFIGIGVLVMFFMAASDISQAGKNISRISSVGGKTLEEAYYSELGDVYRGYALAIRAFGIFAFAIISKVGKTKSF